MKKADLKSAREDKLEVVVKKLSEARAKLADSVKAKFKGGEKNLKIGHNLRRDIAQLSTIITERKEGSER